MAGVSLSKDLARCMTCRKRFPVGELLRVKYVDDSDSFFLCCRCAAVASGFDVV